MWLIALVVVVLLVAGYFMYRRGCVAPGAAPEKFSADALDRLLAQAPMSVTQGEAGDGVDNSNLSGFIGLSGGAPQGGVLPADPTTAHIPGDIIAGTLPVTADSYNSQRNEYISSARRRGVNSRLKDLPLDLFSSPVADSAVFYKNGRPVQSMFNNPEDLNIGVVDRINMIGKSTLKPGVDLAVPNTLAVTPDQVLPPRQLQPVPVPI